MKECWLQSCCRVFVTVLILQQTFETMRRSFILVGFVLWFCSCSNSGDNNTAADSAGTNSAIMTDTNNASKNTGVDMSGGVNSGKDLDNSDSGKVSGSDSTTKDGNAGNH